MPRRIGGAVVVGYGHRRLVPIEYPVNPLASFVPLPGLYLIGLPG